MPLGGVGQRHEDVNDTRALAAIEGVLAAEVPYPSGRVRMAARARVGDPCQVVGV